MTPTPPATRAVLLLPLAALFVGSGCAALIYEIVWLQLLQMVVGSSAVSLGLLLGIFLGGMSLGGVLLPRVVSPGRHPLRVYAVLEIGTAVLGIAVLYGMPLADWAYGAVGTGGVVGLVLRACVCAFVLLPPAVLMGATLPAAARWVESTPQGASRLGLFYAGNLAGAVAGCVLAGFYLLRLYDIVVATYAAAGLNVAVAAIALGLAALVPYRAAEAAPAGGTAAAEPLRWPVYLAAGLSGFTALGAEVIWTRLLSLLFGATVYSFSIILAVFLVGLGLGGAGGSALAGRVARPWAALAGCQGVLAAAIAWAAYQLAATIPYWPIDPRLSPSPWIGFQLDVVRCLWAVLPAALLWGASFPLALAAAAVPGRDPGRVAGEVYAANTAGAVVGAVGFGVFGLGYLGTWASQVVLMGVAGAAAGAAVLAGRREPAWGPWLGRAGVGVAAAALAVGVGRVTIPPTPWELVAWGRGVQVMRGESEPVFIGEGVTASVAVTEKANGERIYHVSGRPEASTAPQDMRVQRMLGHLPALLHPAPKTALVVGCGAGVTAGSLLTHPSIERVVVCEIEPLVPAEVAPRFAAVNNDLVNDPRVEFVLDDARHYIRTTRETFDVITSDPIHPWLRGAAPLYTAEYFELVKRRLNPGGVVAQWVPLYESTPDVVRSELATFFATFPDGTVWANVVRNGGYDVVMIGQLGPTRVAVPELIKRVDQPDHDRVRESVTGVGFVWLADLLGTYAGRGRDLAPWLEGAQVNRDRDLRLQYLAGLHSTAAGENLTFEALRAYRRYPRDLLEMPPDWEVAFRKRAGFPPRD
jgi:spermidine synthase